MRILLVEDDALLGGAIRDHLAGQGFAVDWSRTKSAALDCFETVDYGLVVLDMRLPDGKGIDILKILRGRGDTVPVIVATAEDQISDRIEGLNSGADDYLVKPFDLHEMDARIAAVIRRYRGNPAPMKRFGRLEINATDRRVFDGGREIELSAREWAVLDILAMRPGAVVSKERIEEALYAFGSKVESNTVEVYVSRLRKKLGRDNLQTVRGLGYKLVAAEP